MKAYTAKASASQSLWQTTWVIDAHLRLMWASIASRSFYRRLLVQIRQHPVALGGHEAVSLLREQCHKRLTILLMARRCWLCLKWINQGLCLCVYVPMKILCCGCSLIPPSMWLWRSDEVTQPWMRCCPMIDPKSTSFLTVLFTSMLIVSHNTRRTGPLGWPPPIVTIAMSSHSSITPLLASCSLEIPSCQLQLLTTSHSQLFYRRLHFPTVAVAPLTGLSCKGGCFILITVPQAINQSIISGISSTSRKI